MSTPVHQAMLGDGLMRLSPIQPEMGSIGTLSLINSFFQPTLVSIDDISLEISS